MTEVEERGAFGAKKLVLGFDAGCMTCSELARKIEEEVGDKLEVRPLHHPQVAHWREQALGNDAPWAPTLIELNGGEAKAWMGLKMALVLSRRLGPGATWRVMQLVGEIKSVPKAIAASGVGLSRGQFIKNLGGVALGVGVLSASGGLASPALAQDDLDEEGLVEAFSLIEQIPDSVMAQGDEAAREWLRAELQSESQAGTFKTQGAWACIKSIINFVLETAIPIGKLRSAIRAFGGARKLGGFIIRRYRRLRRKGYGRARSIRKVARLISIKTRKTTGEQVLDAFLTLFGAYPVKRDCF